MSAGCGMLLYPERRGQPSGRLDWGIVLLDALGLLLFFVPGVIAFAVDFATGTIYLPPEPPPQALTNKPGKQLVAVKLPRDGLDQDRIEQVVSRHAGRPIHLVEGQFQTEHLGSIADFWQAVARLAARGRSADSSSRRDV